jgi:hypothetical protein
MHKSSYKRLSEGTYTVIGYLRTIGYFYGVANTTINIVTAPPVKQVKLGETFSLAVSEQANVIDTGAAVRVNKVSGDCNPSAENVQERSCVELTLFKIDDIICAGGGCVNVAGALLYVGQRVSLPSLDIQARLLSVDLPDTANIVIEKYVNLETRIDVDKFRYFTGEPLRISMSAKGDPKIINQLEFYAVIEKPDGVKDKIKLARVSNPPGYYYYDNRFEGVYTDTNLIGDYKIGIASNFNLYSKPRATFTVIDRTPFEKFLIFSDIGEYKFQSADVQKGSYSGVSYNLYLASYMRNNEPVLTYVMEFNSREDAEKTLRILKKDAGSSYTIKEDTILGNKVLILSTNYNYGNQKIVLWTNKNLILAVIYQDYIYSIIQATEATVSGGGNVTTGQICPAVCTPMWELKDNACVYTSCGSGCGPDAVNTFATESACKAKLGLEYCGTGTMNASCYCKEGETKRPLYGDCPPDEQCSVVVYLCEKQEVLPLPIINAYLKKYPSDLYQDLKKKEVTQDELLEIVMGLEDLKTKFDKLQKDAISLANYYRSIGDVNNTQKFEKVANMFGGAKEMANSIELKIKNNINNPEAIIDEVRNDVIELKALMRRILLVIVGASEEATTASVLQATG